MCAINVFTNFTSRNVLPIQIKCLSLTYTNTHTRTRTHTHTASVQQSCQDGANWDPSTIMGHTHTPTHTYSHACTRTHAHTHQLHR